MILSLIGLLTFEFCWWVERGGPVHQFAHVTMVELECLLYFGLFLKKHQTTWRLVSACHNKLDDMPALTTLFSLCLKFHIFNIYAKIVLRYNWSFICVGQHYAMAGLKTCLVVHSQDPTADYLLNFKIGTSPTTCNNNLSAVRLETTKVCFSSLNTFSFLWYYYLNSCVLVNYSL